MDNKISEKKNEDDELENLFKKFDEKLGEVEQKFLTLENDLKVFRKEKNVDNE
jgi:hypothetical protein